MTSAFDLGKVLSLVLVVILNAPSAHAVVVGSGVSVLQGMAPHGHTHHP